MFLGGIVAAYPLLSEFSCTLVLSVTDQLNNTLLIWGETVDE